MSAPVRPGAGRPQRERELADRIRFELADSIATYRGAAILARGNERTPASAEQRDRVNVEGVGAGCHECGSVLATDPDQPWIGDHVPPWKLTDRVRQHYGLPGHDNTWILPSCQACSSLQSALVIRLNTAQFLPPAASLTIQEQRMLGIVRTWNEADAVRATGRQVLGTQGLHAQASGVGRGCHICPARVPHLRYVADHNPPAQFNTPSMQRLCEHLDIDLPRTVVLLPHCIRCSSGQGPRIRAVVAMAEQYMEELGWSGGRHATPVRFRDGSDERDDERTGRQLRREKRGRSRSPQSRDPRDLSPKRHGPGQ